MIFGIGTDMVRIDRVEAVYARFGEKFVNRLLMPQEIAEFASRKRKIRFLAMRFAAKEAIVKALGTGFGHGVWIRDIGVLHNDWGRPEVIFSARGEQLCEQLGAGAGYVSLSDEAGFAMAFAVLERR
ncbi:MAG: holo-ACP synthase [Gammaproteobacteria bacterium]|nr:holo-ACP synthase [Gammaproteobacteria bacterium]NNF59787.1 holo-ACP synthase [Gammaproteobacteria bacterium]NNM20981.1 holo-ACP synthase [Gammaproteobacteria bacterium]